MQAHQIMALEDSGETVLYAALEYTAEDEVVHEIPVPVIIHGFDMELDPLYDEHDWLQKNKIHTLKVDFALDTFLLYADENISIPTEVIFNFLSAKGVLDADEPMDSDPQTLITEYFSLT